MVVELTEPYKIYISDEVLQEKMQAKYGKKYKLKTEMSYQHRHKSTRIDIHFTSDKKALWAFRYKGVLYMNIIDGIKLKDKYSIIDIYTTLVENAIATFNQLQGVERAKKAK